VYGFRIVFNARVFWVLAHDFPGLPPVFHPTLPSTQVWTAWVLIQYKSSRRLENEIPNDQPRIVEIQFYHTTFLFKMFYWIERLVLCLLTSCLTRSTLCCESIRSIFSIVIIFLLLTVGFPLPIIAQISHFITAPLIITVCSCNWPKAFLQTAQDDSSSFIYFTVYKKVCRLFKFLLV